MGIMNLAELLDSSVFILRKYCKSFIIFNLGYWAVAFIVLMILVMAMALGMAGSMVASGGETAGMVVFIGLLVLLFTTVGFCNSVGAIHIASQEVLQIKQDAAKAIGSSIKKTFPVMGLVFLGIVPLIPIGYGLWKLAGGTVQSLTENASLDMLSSMGSADQRMLLTILGLLLALLVLLALLNAYLTLFTYALPSMVLENKGPAAAVKRSIQLLRGQFWHMYGVVSLIVLVMYGISASLDSFFLMLSGLAELMMHVVGLEPGMGFTFIYAYGRGFANFLYALLFNSLGAVVLTQLYYNRVFETEGYDLKLRLSRLPSVSAGEEDA